MSGRGRAINGGDGVYADGGNGTVYLEQQQVIRTEEVVVEAIAPNGSVPELSRLKSAHRFLHYNIISKSK